MTNVVVLVGRLARPAQLRHLPSGDFLVEYQVTVPRTGQRADSVPVVWERAPARKNRRRTEVVAESVVPSRLAKRARASVAAALARIQQAAEPRASRASG
jgi:hypothetical protein